jgi:DNA-binding PadR family transcriptional regulator
MPQKRSNPLALAVLVFLFERPMHPYEMAATLRERHKEESIKLRYGSLYTVIGLLESSGLIRPKETTRDGNRPERTVYELTPAGEEEMREWMREILRTPVKEFPQFEAGLSLLPALPPEEAAELLDARTDLLNKEIEKVHAALRETKAMKARAAVHHRNRISSGGSEDGADLCGRPGRADSKGRLRFPQGMGSVSCAKGAKRKAIKSTE